MLRHTGQKRSFRHNLRLAVLLCLNAGFINAAGFIAFQVLTTNVTGHAALLAVDVASAEWRSARMVALWLLLFLAGAFFSGLFISRVGRDRRFAYTLPMVLIIAIVLFVAVFGHGYDNSLVQKEYFAGSLLFAMGMQNALVSMVSGSVVRTTHLTGMFTDLGIDMSSVLFSNSQQQEFLKRKIILRLTIISCFLLGGIIGGLLFRDHGFTAFYIPVGIMIIAMFYDYFRIKIARAIQQTTRSRQ